jgi:hypothetical protein
MASRRWPVAPVLVLTAACTTTRHPPKELPRHAAAPSPSRQRAAAPSAVAGRPPGPPEPRLDEGCSAEVPSGEQPLTALEELRQRCIASMQPLPETPRLLRLTEGTDARLTFELDGHPTCVRAGAAAEPSLTMLDVDIIDPQGTVHAAPAAGGPFALLGPEGPLCFDRQGLYAVRVHARQGHGMVAVGLWWAR